jgi:hypothetical protein
MGIAWLCNEIQYLQVAINKYFVLFNTFDSTNVIKQMKTRERILKKGKICIRAQLNESYFCVRKMSQTLKYSRTLTQHEFFSIKK